MKTEYIPQENADRLHQILTRASGCYFKVYDTESHVITTRFPEKLINAIDGGDEEIRVEIYDRSTREYHGTLCLLPYEYDSMPYDYSDNPFMKKLLDF